MRTDRSKRPHGNKTPIGNCTDNNNLRLLHLQSIRYKYNQHSEQQAATQDSTGTTERKVSRPTCRPTLCTKKRYSLMTIISSNLNRFSYGLLVAVLQVIT